MPALYVRPIKHMHQSFAETLVWCAIAVAGAFWMEVEIQKRSSHSTLRRALQMAFVTLPFVLVAIPKLRHGLVYDGLRLWALIAFVYLCVRFRSSQRRMRKS